MSPDEAFDYFRRAFESERFAHAYIIEGDIHGAGLTLVEQTLGLLFCGSNKKPCGTCKACTQVKRHTHADVLWVEPQKKSRIISVEQVRDLQQLIYQTSFAGGWKACVLVGADRLGAEASNAFLKTLEEPPEKSVFFLLTNSPQSLLPTIISRCQYMSVSGAETGLRDEWTGTLFEILEAENKTPLADMGNAERLRKLLKEMKSAAKTIENEKAEAANTEEEDETIDARAEARYREWRNSLMRIMLNWHRDIMMIVCGVAGELLFNATHAAILKQRAGSLSLQTSLCNVRVIEEMNRQLDQSLPDATVLNFGFSRLAQ